MNDRLKFAGGFDRCKVLLAERSAWFLSHGDRSVFQGGNTWLWLKSFSRNTSSLLKIKAEKYYCKECRTCGPFGCSCLSHVWVMFESCPYYPKLILPIPTDSHSRMLLPGTLICWQKGCACYLLHLFIFVLCMQMHNSVFWEAQLRWMRWLTGRHFAVLDRSNYQQDVNYNHHQSKD